MNLCAEGTEVTGDVLVAPQYVVDVTDGGRAFCLQRRHREGCAAPQVGGMNLCAVEPLHAADEGYFPSKRMSAPILVSSAT